MKTFAEMKKIFSSEELKKSKKRSALKKSLGKLEKKDEKLVDALKTAGSGKRKKELQIKLETNRRHQKKARKLIKEVS